MPAGVALVLVVMAIVGYLGEAKRDDSGAVTKAGDAAATSLRVGDCVKDPEDALGAEVEKVGLVPCAQPHKGEVYATFALTGDFPGDDAVQKRSEAGCVQRFERFVGLSYEDSTFDVIYISPTKQLWKDDKGVRCLLSADNLVGTARGTKR